MSWRTRWATGARECAHGQLAAAAAAVPPAPVVTSAEPARVRAAATAAPYRMVPYLIVRGRAVRVRVPGVRCQARTMTPPALGCRRGWRRWSHSDPEDPIRQYLTQSADMD